MAFRILRMFFICFITAALLNVANFFVCYYIHINRITKEDNWFKYIWEEEIEEPTTTKWDNKIKSMLFCGENSTNCPIDLSEKSNVEENNSETTEKFNGFYYYIHDAVLSNTRVCPLIPPGLGPVETDDSLLELNAFDEMFSYIKTGGLFKPMQCIPRQSIAVIIPMQDVDRSWKNYIGITLFYLHLFLMKQLPEYQIFVIIQVGDPKAPFARGKLMNIGFIESNKMRRNGWDCLVFQDAFYIPTNTRNLYRCTKRPRRLISMTGDSKKFGGIVAIRPSIFKKVNGFSNLDWYNDGDYINMYQRLHNWNYTIETSPSTFRKYTTLNHYPHINLSRPDQPLDKFHATTPIHLIDGLSSLSYEVVNAGLRQLFTFIEVDLSSQE